MEELKLKALRITVLSMTLICLIVSAYIYFEAWIIAAWISVSMGVLGCFYLLYSVTLEILKSNEEL